MKFTTLKQWMLVCSLVVIVALIGCSKEIFFEDEAVVIDEVNAKEFPIELYVLEEVNFGKYEPEQGIYTGAYVQKDKYIHGDLLAYEELTGQTQTFKVFTYNSEEGISKQDILKCIAQKKTPYIKLVLKEDYDLTPLYQLIFDLKLSYHTPIFIELYPLTEKEYKVSQYKETYQRAYEILHKYLSDIVVVWSTDEARICDMALYYPGNGYVDWAGLNVYIPRYKNGVRYVYEGTTQLDYWYKSFQNKKPMLISALAISHFSKVDHAYAIYETQNKLMMFYNDVLMQYPRLRGIIYMDVDMAQISSIGKEDYSLLGEDGLCETMKSLSMPLKIHGTLENEMRKSSCYMKYSIKASMIEEQLYIPQEYMALCFKDVPLRKLRHFEDLGGAIYYAYDDIKEYCTTYYKA
ncbi:MAG: glycosyl hydrolase [Cellulosilyticum sp.]|nr:hypothetical protein [Cellulosilyticum sp.]MEE1073501.1 glycosyl hydrolase [Cellulosilyticum sp.]